MIRKLIYNNNIMENYTKIVVKCPAKIKEGDLILFDKDIICEIISIYRKTKSDENECYSYEFTGKLSGEIYRRIFYCGDDIVKYIEIDGLRHDCKLNLLN